MKTNTKELKDFIQTWQTQGSEVADKVTYWNTLLELLGVPKQQIENKTYIEYEKPIKLRENEKFHGSIDAYIPSTKVLIEQKSNGVDLFKAESRPNGGDTEKITPFEQAKRFEYFNAKLFLHQTNTSDKQYCLYLAECPNSVIKSNHFIYDRVKKVKEFRENSRGKSTQKLADTPSQYFIAQRPKTHSIVLPVVSSGNRKYIPMKFLTEEVVLTNALFYIDNANLYEFSILESSVHMAWLRTIGGRLKSDYRYATSLVYNTFPWSTPTEEQRKKIEQTAQAILDARNNHPEASLADLYDPLLMPPDLRKAHKANDKAVLQAYGLKPDATESEIVAHLFKMYEKLTKTK